MVKPILFKIFNSLRKNRAYLIFSGNTYHSHFSRMIYISFTKSQPHPIEIDYKDTLLLLLNIFLCGDILTEIKANPFYLELDASK